ncbi:glycoside hydrolase family 3 protein [Vibrio ulleungensis]|uniref:Glycoside hydrolase family 3 protein n=1 Tax=Vibrio ulleungensis TaxID=2807619 RepID=A0ABS2HPT5_9VIBR|nr:glycoside hydrolase family 3 protein [Vibrio ulleungensis]MBM7038228.1 glycoside hydrolase family 3 protein [Vibrio ulleungensis]
MSDPIQRANDALKAQQILAPVSRQAAAEGIVLLRNHQHVLPLLPSDKVSLFGRCQVDYYRSGTGSGGAVNVPYTVNAVQGMQNNQSINLNQELVAIYQDWLANNPFDDGGGGWAAEPWFQHEMPLDDNLVSRAKSISNKAVVFVGRTAGEDQDNALTKGSFLLTDTEQKMIDTVCAHFDQVIVVLNVTNVIDMSWLDEGENRDSIKGVLYSWAAGMEGGDALADILSGDVTPSGRLTDSIAYQLSDHPSDENFGSDVRNLYVEDIYVGYRYFETFAPEKIRFPFGAGLSYTSFSKQLNSYTVEGSAADAVLHFDVLVTNTGNQYSGKEVASLYVTAPQGKLGQPIKALVGFNKTSTLAPGESEILTIRVPAHVLSSYDDSGVTGHKSCWLLEAGDYQFSLGGSVREAAHIDACWSIKSTLIIDQVSEALAPVIAFERIKPELSEGSFSLGLEAVNTRSIDLEKRIIDNLPTSYTITGDKGIRLEDVKQGRAEMRDFIAQLNAHQLATIVRGEGMCSPKVTPGTAAAFGGVSDELFQFGIPVAAASDGPSGIRMDSGHPASQVPIGTLLACTWNTELNHQLYTLVGKEMQANEIDTLLGPGMNIHRHPLNGRNFEYFSEDPFLTGKMACAQTLGLKHAGVSGTVKHFAANDQETGRHHVDSVMSERALREIHLKGFEMVVKEGEASTIMTTYNPVNGHWTASSYDLNTTILRQEWGYTGIVMSDWWAKMNHCVSGGEESISFTSFMVRSQNDLYMVVENDKAEHGGHNDDTLAALDNGTLTIGELQRCAMNICRFIIDAPVMQRPLKAYEPIKPFSPKSQADEHAILLESNTPLGTKNNTTRTIRVTQAGVYRCSVQASYEKDSLAQSTCSLLINDDFAMTFSLNGTEGKTQTVEGVPIRLEVGDYHLQFNFVKPGLYLDSLTLVQS